MADYADSAVAAAALQDPALPAADLQSIAAAQPALRAQVAAHPSAYPALLDWLERRNDPAVTAAVAARRAAAGAAAGAAVTQPLGQPVTATPSVTPAAAAPLSGAPDQWLAPTGFTATPASAAASPDFAAPYSAAPGQNVAYPASVGTPSYPANAAVPLTQAGAVTTPPRSRRGLLIGVTSAVVVLALVGSLVYAFHDRLGLGGALGGPPELTEEQFYTLAEETLPEQTGAQPLDVSTPGYLGDILAGICPGDPVEGSLLEATQTFNFSTNTYVTLQLFETADQADAYLDYVSTCQTSLSQGFFTTKESSDSGVRLIDVAMGGLTLEYFAGYGNIVASGYTPTQEWSDYAVKNLKPAIDKAAKS
ncbi:MAG: hypothetical protein LBR33_09965 [Propionibacteriaceae bacterium]|jgi:hypothetical protein|nr:hypothetical protein [Propionibacteriaceae bacterium]